MAASRVVIVTGGAAGIGWAASQRFAAAGDLVLLADRNGDAAKVRAESLGPQHLGLSVDVSREADVVAMVAACRDRYGRLDVLINNAGVIDAQATPAFDQPLENFRTLMGVNVLGAYLAAREAARVMLSQGGGAIVNLASGAGVAAVPYRNGYGASKAAVAALTRTLACEWAAHGVRVNAVAPGYTRTAMVEALIANGKVDPTLVERRIPLGRMADPSEIAEAIFFLASDAACAVTGDLMVADGGFLAFGGTGAASTASSPRPASKGPRTIVVNNGGAGIGLAAAQAFAGFGDRVMVIDRDEASVSAAADALGPSHRAITVDPLDEAVIEGAMASAAERWGGVDVLVNAPVAIESAAPTVKQTTAQFETAWDAHLTAPYIAARSAGRWMAKGGGGSIVNVASTAGLSALPPHNAYCAAHAGVLMLSRSLACEWAQAGVRVNAVAVGPWGGLGPPGPGGRPGEASEQNPAPMGRWGRAGEVADIIRFLASDAASYVTGSVLTVDGGERALGADQADG